MKMDLKSPKNVATSCKLKNLIKAVLDYNLLPYLISQGLGLCLSALTSLASLHHFLFYNLSFSF